MQDLLRFFEKREDFWELTGLDNIKKCDLSQKEQNKIDVFFGLSYRTINNLSIEAVLSKSVSFEGGQGGLIDEGFGFEKYFS